jgi:hypothetical protein
MIKFTDVLEERTVCVQGPKVTKASSKEFCLRLEPEDSGSIFLPNVGEILNDYTASYTYSHRCKTSNTGQIPVEVFSTHCNESSGSVKQRIF